MLFGLYPFTYCQTLCMFEMIRKNENIVNTIICTCEEGINYNESTGTTKEQ